MNILWYFAFFLVSGYCSLVYETVWLRLSMAAFGVTTPTVSIVLSIFMAGLAIGSWAGGKLVRRLEPLGPTAPLRVYGVIELIIGLSGLVVPQLINWGHELMRQAGPGLAWDSSRYYLASGGWMALSLLPWCTCMGATLPLGMAAIRGTVPQKSERSFSYLYLSNVVGAILGTLIPTLFLVEILGFRGTLRIATSFNAFLSAAALAVSLRNFPDSEAAAAPVAVPQTPVRLYGLPPSGTFWLLFLTGLCSMAMEVVWIRLFTIYLGNMVYSFATILALYLGATYAGSQLYRIWIRTHEAGESVKGWILLGLLSLLPVLFADPAVGISPLPTGHISFSIGSELRAAFGVVPFSTALGFLTPMLVDHYSAGDPDRAGRAYAVNVLGSIIGPLIAGFWILPWLGEHWGLMALSLPLFGIGLMLIVYQSSAPEFLLRRRWNTVSFAGAIVLSIPLVAKTHGYQAQYRGSVELRDYTATVLASGSGMNKLLMVNGLGMTVLTPITKFMAHMPLAFLDHPAKRGLVICFGMGTTFRSMLSWGIDTTAVDLVPSVPKLFGFYHPDGPELMRLPIAHVVADDGRRFLERSNEKYDVITLDPPPPVNTPTTGLLYSSEFYSVVSHHLAPGGIVQIWIYVQDHPNDRAFPAAAAKAIVNSFPYIRAYASVGKWGYHILASNSPIPNLDAATLAARMPPQAAADFVEWNPKASPEVMFETVLVQPAIMEKIENLEPRVPPLRDDQPINEYFFLRSVFGYYR